MGVEEDGVVKILERQQFKSLITGSIAQENKADLGKKMKESRNLRLFSNIKTISKISD